ncbi:nucleotidyltransferase family protein [Thermosphaera sp.]|uniref:Nucleotidyltransferase family protein n=1 Tax=Thermosphaera aggregans TaxID=54254 RepID=A0A7C2FNM3_9CREN
MISCIVTAAGLSRRFEGNKLLFKYYDRPLIAQTISNIVESKRIGKIIVVTGFMSREVEEAINKFVKDERIIFVYNPNYQEGMSSSVRKGIEFLVSRNDSIDGVMVNPGDAAWIHPFVYDLVVNAFYNYKPLIAVASYNGRRGHPILFSASLLNDLANIDESTKGLKKIVEKHYSNILQVETLYPGVILDFDSYLDYVRVKNTLMR